MVARDGAEADGHRAVKGGPAPIVVQSLIGALIGAAALAQPVELQDRYFASDGIRIRYVDVGRGEPVLLFQPRPSPSTRGAGTVSSTAWPRIFA